jgi:hypothetical protein
MLFSYFQFCILFTLNTTLSSIQGGNNPGTVRFAIPGKNKGVLFLRFEIRYYICNSLKRTEFRLEYCGISPYKGHSDPVAQQVEHIPFKDGVLGSNPSWITSIM